MDRRQLNRYLENEQYPSADVEDMIRCWIENLKATIQGRCPSDAHAIAIDAQIIDPQLQEAPGAKAKEPSEAPSPYSDLDCKTIGSQTVCSTADPNCDKCPLKGRPRVDGCGAQGGVGE